MIPSPVSCAQGSPDAVGPQMLNILCLNVLKKSSTLQFTVSDVRTINQIVFFLIFPVFVSFSSSEDQKDVYKKC